MNLMMEEEFDKQFNKKNDNSKMVKIILIIIVSLCVLSAIIGGIIYYLNSLVFKTSIDGSVKGVSTDFYYIEEGTNVVYVSIKEFAKLAGYEYYNGEFNSASEDVTKCYVKNTNEIASFGANTKVLYKTQTADMTSSDKFILVEDVKMVNNKLYASLEGIQIGFNVNFEYNTENNYARIYTLPYLVQIYNTDVAQKGFVGISEKFDNQKAVLQGLLVVGKGDSEGKNVSYGVINLQGNQVIGNKYQDIDYVEINKEFFVKSNNKTGIVSITGETVIDLTYSAIEVLDKDSNLYVITLNDKKGIINKLGNYVYYPEITQVGIDTSLYASNDIKNPMLLYNNCIPVKVNDKVGIVSKTGQVIVPLDYSDFGCISGTSKDNSKGNLLVIPKYEGIVVKKVSDKVEQYGIVNSVGKVLVPCYFDKIYSVTSSGQSEYYLELKGETFKLSDFLEEMQEKEKAVEDAKNANTENTQTNIVTTIENMTNDNTITNNIVENNAVNTN